LPVHFLSGIAFFTVLNVQELTLDFKPKSQRLLQHKNRIHSINSLAFFSKQFYRKITLAGSPYSRCFQGDAQKCVEYG
jgi:hypothetical protein